VQLSYPTYVKATRQQENIWVTKSRTNSNSNNNNNNDDDDDNDNVV